MRLERFEIGQLQTNCYVLFNEEESKIIIIDPGYSDKYLLEYLKSLNVTCEGILLTHGHGDHISGVNKILEIFKDTPIYAGEKEDVFLGDRKMNLSKFIGSEEVIITDYCKLKDKQELNLIGKEIKCFDMPGHTIGGMAYYFENENIVFAGDSIFYHSVGRTDLATGNESELIASIKNLFSHLSDDTLIYTGHGNMTNVLEEKSNNPYLR